MSMSDKHGGNQEENKGTPYETCSDEENWLEDVPDHIPNHAYLNSFYVIYRQIPKKCKDFIPRAQLSKNGYWKLFMYLLHNCCVAGIAHWIRMIAKLNNHTWDDADQIECLKAAMTKTMTAITARLGESLKENQGINVERMGSSYSETQVRSIYQALISMLKLENPSIELLHLYAIRVGLHLSILCLKVEPKDKNKKRGIEQLMQLEDLAEIFKDHLEKHFKWMKEVIHDPMQLMDLEYLNLKLVLVDQKNYIQEYDELGRNRLSIAVRMMPRFSHTSDFRMEDSPDRRSYKY